MKKTSLYQAVAFLVISLISLQTLFSQPRMDSETRYVIQSVEKEFKQSGGQSAKWKWMLTQYPIYQNGNDYSVAFVAKKNINFTTSELENKNMGIGTIVGDIVTLRVPVTGLSAINQITGLQYIEVSGKIHPDLDKTVFDTRVDSVHKGINLPDIYNGTDVIIGITDWGFDYAHPMFYDTLLTQTRIMAAWDQSKISGPAPAGHTFGTEYIGETELLAASCDTAGVYGTHYHGSHVAGIAGGSGAGLPFRGIAYESEFLFVTLKGDVAASIEAFSWMKAKADAAGKRLVTNQSWGGYTSTLDGNSLLSQAMDTLVNQNVVMCNSGGNCGDDNFHILHDFNSDTMKTRVGFYTYSDTSMWGQNVTMWGEPGHSFQAKYVFLNASNVYMGETPMFNTTADTNYIDTTYIMGTDTLYYRLIADDAHPQNGKPHMRFKIKCMYSYKIVLQVYADSGKVHCWNVMERKTGTSNWGIDFLTLGAGYTVGDNNYGIGEPGVTENLITVAAHYPEYKNGLGNIVSGYICAFSSFGPIIDGRMKPDVSAPGGNIASSMNRCTDLAYTLLTNVNFNSVNYPFAKLSGTSMSSPATAGVCALILDANPSLTSQEVKDIIMTSAREDAITGDIPDSGSTRWGQGKVNAHLAVAMALNIVNINTFAQQGMVVFPNPTQDQVFILSNKNPDKVYNLAIYSMEGQMVQTGTYQWNMPIEVYSLAPGMYAIQITSDNESYQCRFIKN